MKGMLYNNLTQASRKFQYDYIYIDIFFLSLWLGLLIKYKKWNALKFSFITGLIVYLIDAVWWWNALAGTRYSPDTYIREYWIGDIEMPHPLGDYLLVKFGADFMMTISYSLFAFGWLWIVFDNIRGEKQINELILFTVFYFCSWIIIPLLSILLPLNDTIVYTVRHMDTQFIIWILNVIVGYGILSLIYGTNIINRKNPKILGYVFLIGCLQSFFMEFPLFVFGIRPKDFAFFVFEIFFLFNQGAPYLFIVVDIILPSLRQD